MLGRLSKLGYALLSQAAQQTPSQKTYRKNHMPWKCMGLRTWTLELKDLDQLLALPLASSLT